MKFSIENQDNVVIFQLKNLNLDSEISAQLKAKLLILIQPDIEALIIDLTNVEYVDSSGLGALLLAQRQMKEFGMTIILVGVTENVQSMFRISQIHDVFLYADTIQDAIEKYID
jgi:anti-sigma B factor antagonist